MDDKNYKKLLDNYINLYINSTNLKFKEWNIFWTVFVVYLTTMVPLTIYIIHLENLIALWLLPFIHIGFTYGILIKMIDLEFCSLNESYLEFKINNILKKIDERFIEFLLIRNSKIRDIFGDYKDKPMKHKVFRFVVSFWFIPVVFFAIALLSMGYFSFKQIGFNNFKSYITFVLIIIYIVIEFILGILFSKATEYISKESIKIFNVKKTFNK